MKLLFDQNISPVLASKLKDAFPESTHVFHLGLHEASDTQIWKVAREQNFILVTKDQDFVNIAEVEGMPPCLVWIRKGNCSTRDIETALRKNTASIQQLGQGEISTVLIY